ncbi:SPASM domain-containing protein [Infirmifilum lucidum]|uniref:SPASM domain-containing protein n=1 Tax=Infirmifilum lucidum TaxID=2776706 RepID=A0A7L9FI90_9CREN|nr:radical SAM protein [Infirmifilum lucidum]QOJ79082.1 SPASM domain-containing protein [Infirmifilum lucidum]
MSFPEVLQVEPTNTCNLSCIMCVRRTWRQADFGYMSWSLFKKIVDESTGRIRRLALYGFGEPLSHPRFVDFAAYARTVLGDGVFIHFVTNGTLMDGNTARRVFEAGVDQVAFSVDAPDIKPLSEIRVGAQHYNVLGNLRETARVKRDYGARVGVAVVLMKRNYRMLPEIVERAGELDLDFVVVSQMVPYHPALVGEAVYTTASREAVEFFREAGGELDSLAKEAVYDSLLAHYKYVSSGRQRLYLQLVEKIASRGYSVNADIARDAIKRESLLKDVEEYIERAREHANKYGIEARLPSVYADSLKRTCPYVDENATMILWDGSVAPCMDLAYNHPLYTNFHVKSIKAVRFGNVTQESIEDVWNKPSYVQFRRVRRKLPSSVPWCADCPFATKKCWFVDANEYDCYGNEVGCNECIYSAGLAHCIL